MRQIIFFLFLVTTFTARAQPAESGRPFFDAVVFAGEAPDSSRADLYLAIPYSALTFERKDAIFAGRYQVRVHVEGEGRGWLDSTFVRSITTSSHGTTTGQTPAYEFYQQRVMLPAGSYTATMELLDLQKNLVTTEHRTITAASIAGRPFALSGLMLVKKIREDGGGHVITPMVTESVAADADGYFLFFEAYNNSGQERFRIEATYHNGTNTISERQLFERTIPAGRSQQWVRMPTEQTPRGVFTVELRATPLDDTTHTLATSKRTVRLEGVAMGVPLAEEELNDKVTQLRYVGTQSDIDFIRSATTLAERQRRYAEFWSKFDPTPTTPENEAMNEYFQRVEYADAHFRSYAAGWLTDRGRVYVIYGPPDNVSTDPFRTDGRAVESWHYYRRSIRLNFIDESGFGDFRLSAPISPGEKYRYGQ